MVDRVLNMHLRVLQKAHGELHSAICQFDSKLLRKRKQGRYRTLVLSNMDRLHCHSFSMLTKHMTRKRQVRYGLYMDNRKKKNFSVPCNWPNVLMVRQCACLLYFEGRICEEFPQERNSEKVLIERKFDATKIRK